MSVRYDEVMKVTNETYLMAKGVRDAALVTFNIPDYYDTVYDEPDETLKKIVTDILARGFKYKFIPFTTEDDDMDYMDIFIYKYDHQWEMYETSQIMKASKDEDAYRVGEYLMAKLLGYSESDIHDYLDNPNKELIKKVEVPDDFYEKNLITRYRKFGVEVKMSQGKED